MDHIPGFVTVPSLFGLEANADTGSEYFFRALALLYSALHISFEPDGIPHTTSFLERRPSRKPVDMKEVSASLPALPAPAEYFDHQDPFRTAGSVFSGARHLRKVTLNAWVQCANGNYILRCSEEGYIRVKATERGT